MSRPSLLSGFAYNHASRTIDYAFTYLVSILLARLLLPDDFGTYVTIMSVAGSVVILAGGGWDETLNRMVPARAQEADDHGLKSLVRQAARIRLTWVTVFVLLLILLPDVFSLVGLRTVSPALRVLIGTYVFFQSWMLLLTSLYTARFLTRNLFLFNVAVKAAGVVSLWFFVSEGRGIETVIAILVFMVAFQSVLYFRDHRQTFSKGRQSDERESRSFARTMWINAILSMVLGRYSDILLLGALIGVSAQSGQYEAAATITLLIDYVFTMGLVGSWLSLTSVVATHGVSGMQRLRSTLMRYQQTTVLPVAVFICLYPNVPITIVFSERYLEAAPLLQIALGFLILSLLVANRENASFLFSSGRQSYVLIVRGIIGAINIGTNVLVIPEHGALGAITVTGACVFATNLVEYILVSRIVGFSYDTRTLFLASAAIAAGAGLTMLFSMDSLVSYLLGAALYAVIIGATVVSFRLNPVLERVLGRGSAESSAQDAEEGA